MFDPRPVLIPEAQLLWEQMLTAVKSLPNSPERGEYECIYELISDRLSGDGRAAPMPLLRDGVIARADAFALQLLQQAELASDSDDSGWLWDALNDRRGWLEKESWGLRNGSFATGQGLYLIYFFPSARLASVVAGRRLRLVDPAASVMRGRGTTRAILRKHSFILTPGYPAQKHQLEAVVSALLAHAPTVPYDERLWEALGNVLLRLRATVNRLAHVHDEHWARQLGEFK